MNHKNERIPEVDKIWMDNYFPDIEYAIPPSEQLESLLPITNDSIPDEDKANLIYQYHALGSSSNEEEDLRRLTQLCFNIRMEAYIVASYEFDKLRYDAIEGDLLRLHQACTDSKALSGNIEIRSKYSTIRLNNRFNWVQDVMIRGFLKEHLHNTSDIVEQQRYSIKAGRKSYDPRAGIIMKGVYLMISESHYFSSPMPNNLCSFIIFYLELCGIHPSRQKVDVQWVRSQLRYLISH